MQLDNMQRREQNLTKENIQMENKHVKRQSTFLAIGEMQVNIKMRYHYTLTKMTNIKTVTVPYAGGCGETGSNIKSYSYTGK